MSMKTPLPEDVAVGKQIRSYRLARDMSQTDLANHLGVTFQQIQKYEKGVNRVSAGRLQVIAALYKVHVAELMGVAVPKGGTETPFTLLGQTRDGHRLASAFNKLTGRQDLRYSIVEMVERIADSVEA